MHFAAALLFLMLHVFFRLKTLFFSHIFEPNWKTDLGQTQNMYAKTRQEETNYKIRKTSIFLPQDPSLALCSHLWIHRATFLQV